MTKLSVNINKVATIRNARGGNVPDVLTFAENCELFGAQGITVHPRPDERHIRYQDVLDLKEIVKTELNIEGYPDKRYLDLVMLVQPQQATLVPDAPDVLTSNNGWDVKKHYAFLQDVVGKLKELEIRTSIFLNPEPDLIEYVVKTGVDRIELYTGPYADSYPTHREDAIIPYVLTANEAIRAGIEVNAGHDLNLDNLAFFKKNIPLLAEVSIGQALISDALYFGLEATIQLYIKQLE